MALIPASCRIIKRSVTPVLSSSSLFLIASYSFSDYENKIAPNTPT